MISREGIPYIAFTGALAVVFLVLRTPVVAVAFLLGLVFFVNFFRDPERTPPEDALAIISPADGKIVYAGPKRQELAPEEFLYQVSIFMSPLDVHVNRAPYDGKVREVSHSPGGFQAAYLEDASLHNEQTSLYIDTEHGPILVRQIAGALARRIVCRAHQGDLLRKGQRFGMIKLGSRVDIFLPENTELTVKVGQKVKAGQSILARWRQG
ncbi:MAG: phosphatidylserine decarboxylase family protein [Nitrospirae bacterium]|nr:MAG: phosphatidylserine decarboxylase family protein [Nitrospirota bacterium]